MDGESIMEDDAPDPGAAPSGAPPQSLQLNPMTNPIDQKFSPNQKCNYCTSIYPTTEMTSWRKRGTTVTYYRCSPCGKVRKRVSDVLSEYSADKKAAFKEQANT